MPLRFRNIDASPDDPVESWGFEGMLAAIDRGYARDWRKLVDAVAANADLAATFEEACEAADSVSTVLLVREMLALATRTPSQIALDQLWSAYRGTGLTQAELAKRLGTSSSRLSTYLSGKVKPSMDVLVAVQQIAQQRRAPQLAAHLVLCCPRG